MIPEPMTMNLLAIGQRGRVAELTAAGIQRRRMLDLGLVEGTQVEAVHQEPGWGSGGVSGAGGADRPAG